MVMEKVGGVLCREHCMDLCMDDMTVREEPCRIKKKYLMLQGEEPQYSGKGWQFEGTGL